MASLSRLPSARKPVGGARPVSILGHPSMSNVPAPAVSATNGGGGGGEEGIMNAKKNKRRSLLPQFSRKVSNEEKEDSGNGIAKGIAEEDEEEGHDVYRSSSVAMKKKDSSDEEAVVGGRRKAIDEDRRVMPPPTSKFGRPRPASMMPAPGSQVGRMQAMRAQHGRSDSKDGDPESARAQSLAALTGGGPVTAPPKLAASEMALKRSVSTRLPQTPRPAIPSRTTSIKPKEKDNHSRTDSASTTTSTSTNATSTADNRSSVASSRATSVINPLNGTNSHARAPSMSTSKTNTSPTSPKKTGAASVMTRTRPASMMPQSSKPAFNTYQQHFSPAKSTLPKAPVPNARTTSKAAAAQPPGGGGDEDGSGGTAAFETTKQQVELLQLSLLHQASAKTLRDYTASAKKKLGKRHAQLGREYETVRVSELQHQRVTNLTALNGWCGNDPGGLLVENLQILSMVYSDLSVLVDEGGRFGDLVAMFGRWMDEAEGNVGFVQPLPDDWKSAHTTLALKLRGIQRNLGVLPPAPKGEEGGEPSGLITVLNGCRGLVDGLQRELDIMTELETEVLEREKSRVDHEVHDLVLGEGGMNAPWSPRWVKAAQ